MAEPRTKRSEILGAFFAGLLAVAFCLILLWHNPFVFWNDDYQISILPVFADVARSWSEGHWPLLSPSSWVCNNLAGEFQYGTFSVFVNAAVILIWKFSLTFAQQAAALSITHLFVLAAGSFLLARGRQFSFPLAIFVSIVGTLNGWIICWGASDWFGALGAFAWLPWAWWAMEKALKPKEASPREMEGRAPASPASQELRPPWLADRSRLIRRALWPAPFVYLVVTGGFPYTVVMLGLLVVWLALRTMWEGPQCPDSASRHPGRGTEAPPTFFAVIPLLAGVILGLGLSAPAWLALVNYVHGSAREAQSAAAHWQWLVPWKALPGFILPCWTVDWADFSTRYLSHSATELAGGLVPPAALLAGLLVGGRRFVRKIRWDLTLLLLVLLLSMLPSAGVFRWSFRWLPLVHLLLVLCAAEALRLLPDPGQKVRISAGFVSLLLLAVVTGLMSLGHGNGPYAVPLVWIYFAIAGAWALSDWLVRNPERRKWTIPVVAFLALLATYLCLPTSVGVPRYNFTDELTKPEPLDPQRLYLAVYSPAEFVYHRRFEAGPAGQVSRPGSTPMWAKLRFINGYSPIRPAGVATDFKFFTHGEIDSEFGKYVVQNESGPSGILEQLGVDGLVVPRELAVEPEHAGWDLVLATDEGNVFHRKGAPSPLVRSVTWLDSIPNREFAPAAISNIRDARNAVEFDISVPNGDEPALLTVSRPFFAGYEARLAGKKLTVNSYRGLIPIMEVPAGAQGRVVLTYSPRWLKIGAAVSILCALIFLGGLVMAVRGQRRV